MSTKKYRINRDIKSNSVIVIDENGNNIGELPIDEAIIKAEEAELDLVEVSPLANPPVCKILNFSQFRYKEQQKMKAQQKATNKVVVKCVKLSPNIGKHDLDTKINQSSKFFSKGYKIRIEMQLRGRELQYQNLAKDVINNFIEALNTDKNIVIEDSLKFKNNKLSCTISYKK